MTQIVVENLSVAFPLSVSRPQSLRSELTKQLSRIGGRVVGDDSHGSVLALSDVSFTLKPGDRLGLIGPNGSGKTTLIRTLAGVYDPSSGTRRADGVILPMFDIGLGFDDEGTGYENIYIRGLIMGLTRAEISKRIDEIADFSGLGEYLNMPIRTYSAGMSLRLMFAIATSLEGDIILMDEWLTVGDAEFRKKANARLRRVTEQSGILVLASHDTNLLRETCNLGMYLANGRMLHFGKVDDVIRAVDEQQAGNGGN